MLGNDGVEYRLPQGHGERDGERETRERERECVYSCTYVGCPKILDLNE